MELAKSRLNYGLDNWFSIQKEIKMKPYFHIIPQNEFQ